jgi:hypothetical protein
MDKFLEELIVTDATVRLDAVLNACATHDFDLAWLMTRVDLHAPAMRERPDHRNASDNGS